MTPQLEDYLYRFVNEYDGAKVSILATGGGTALAQIASIPGASRVLHSFYCPYETAESVEFIRTYYPHTKQPEKFAAKAVCAESANNLYMALWTKNKVFGHTEIDSIAITAAITAKRWRRGENRAYISFSNPKTFEHECWLLKLGKPSEQEHALLSMANPARGLGTVRMIEDCVISEYALRLATGFGAEDLKGVITNGTLTRQST